jgi:hypothetical protein
MKKGGAHRRSLSGGGILEWEESGVVYGGGESTLSFRTKEDIIRVKGWFVPAIHKKYLSR